MSNAKCPLELSSTTLPRFSINQFKPFKDRLFGINYTTTNSLLALQFHDHASLSIPDTTTIKLPIFLILRISSQVPLECGPASPTCYSAPNGPPWGDNDVDSTVDVWIFNFGIRSEVSCLGGPKTDLAKPPELCQGCRIQNRGSRRRRI